MQIFLLVGGWLERVVRPLGDIQPQNLVASIPYANGQTFANRSAVRGCDVESSCDDVIRVRKPDAVNNEGLHRVASVRHRYELTHRAFDEVRLLRAHRVDCTTVVNVRGEKARGRPENSKPKEDAWEPLLHPRRWLPENATPDKCRQRQANSDEDKAERGDRPLSVAPLCNIEDGDVIPGIGGRLRQMTGYGNFHSTRSTGDPADKPEEQNELNRPKSIPLGERLMIGQTSFSVRGPFLPVRDHRAGACNRNAVFP